MSVFRNMMLASMRKRRRVSGFVGGWKGYGRSNSEDPATRDILPDYSGNGRDIRLYNFGWTEDSGYNTTTYPGGLVSDGVDDYGQCIKGFSLPDDYTVVAIRRIIEGHDGGFVSKGSTGGAFIFDSTRDNIYCACWSYGTKSTGTPMPDLFSYQSKASYNGQEISYGTAEDTAEDQLTVFRHGTQLYCKGVLYDLRIYDHTLTAEELQIVRDEMMSDYEKATGGYR